MQEKPKSVDVCDNNEEKKTKNKECDVDNRSVDVCGNNGEKKTKKLRK